MEVPFFGDRGTLSPLPENHRRGLIVLTGFSFLSFISTSLLWGFITYKIVTTRGCAWREHRRKKKVERERRQRGQTGEELHAEAPDLSMGLAMDVYNNGQAVDISVLDELAKRRDMEFQQLKQQEQQQQQEQAQQEEENKNKKKIPAYLASKLATKTNPFPLLVYNILLADMAEALAYALSLHWVLRDGIFAPSPTCWAQGWLGSTSHLATSLFLAATSVSTFFTLVLGRRVARGALYAAIGAIWAFVLLVNAAGVLRAERGVFTTASGESYYMRANVWCWISSEYNSWRLWSHYFWIIISVALTLSLYIVIFCVLWSQKRQLRQLSRPRRRVTSQMHDTSGQRDPERPPPPPTQTHPEPPDYHPAFLVYPIVYLVCITPLLVGRISIILGVDLGIPFFAFAGAVSAGNGLFNSLLWTSTILFSAPEDVRAAGLDQFRFGHGNGLRTPARAYGHTVIISGPATASTGGDGGHMGTMRYLWRSGVQRGQGGQGEREREREGEGEVEDEVEGKREWWWWRIGGLRPWGRAYVSAHERVDPDPVRIASDPPVEGPYIQSLSHPGVPATTKTGCADGKAMQVNVVTHVVVEETGG